MTSRLVTTIAAALVLLVANDAAQAAAAKSQPSGGLGESLLEGLLDGELGQTLKGPVPAPPPARPQERDRTSPDLLPDDDALRRMMREEAGIPDGEDVGEGANAMASVVESMRRAEEFLQTPRADRPAVPTQRDVVAQLEKLIEQMEKQCQGGGQCQNPQQNQQQASSRSQAKPSASSKAGPPQQANGQSAARTSTVRMGSSGVNKSALQSPEQLMKAAWGHLPDKVRERMLQGAGDEFLPEYREEIEAYFRRLAEREAENESSR